MNIIVKRSLKDYEAWKQLVSDNNESRKLAGSKGVTIYRGADNPNEVYLVFDWDDATSFTGYFNSPAVQKALADTGTTEIIKIAESFRLEA